MKVRLPFLFGIMIVMESLVFASTLGQTVQSEG